MSQRKTKKPIKDSIVSSFVPPLSSPPPVISAEKKLKRKRNTDKKEEKDQVEQYSWRHHASDYAASGAALLIAIYLIHSSSLSSNDIPIKRPSGQSFLSLYMEGKLHKIDNISQMLLACFVSVFMDIFVVAYHLIFPPHPKFVMRTQRKISIFTHLISGITEIVSGVLAFTIGNNEWQPHFALIMSLASITHVITAYYQTGLVFGAKGIMIPGYIYAITLHANSAFHLYHNLNSLVYVLFTFLMLHIYVWCRFFIFFFRFFNMFTAYHYTVAITLSGCLLFPFTIGPMGNFGMLFVVIGYCGVKAILSHKTGINLSDKLFREHERYALINSDQANEWKSSLVKNSNYDADKKTAREIFDHFDTDKNGLINAAEMYPILSVFNLSVSKVLASVDVDVDGDGQISFNEFYRYIWNVGTVRSRLVQISKKTKKDFVMTPKDKARLVFDLLDIDGSGHISIHELDMLLSQWGMPPKEAHAYFSQNMKGQEKITFKDFHDNLRPVWEFAATQIYNA